MIDLESHFSILPDAVLVHSAERWVYANGAALAMLGASSQEELIGRSVLDIVPPAKREVIIDRIQSAYEKGTPHREQQLYRLDGGVIDVEIAGRPITVAGKPAALIIVRDVSDRKAIEERFRATFEQAAVGMAHVAADGRWLRVNERLCALLGYRREEMLELTFQELMHPDDLAADIAAAEEMIAGRRDAYAREKRYIRKGGEPVWTHATISLVRTADGTPDYFISVVEDISVRKQYELALRDSEERFRSLIEHGSELIVVLDPVGTVEYVSSSLPAITGFQPAQLQGEQVFAFMHHDEIPEHVQLLQKLARDGGAMHTTVHVRHAAGGWRLLDVSAVNMLDNPAVRGIVLNARDVTDRNAMQAELEQLQRVESLGRVAASVTHEFNNLLHGIGMLAAAMAKRGEAPALVESIRRSVERGRAITGDILRYSRRVELARRTIDVVAWLGPLVDDLRAQCGDGCEIELRCDEGLPPLNGDPDQLAQVITNLVLNARDALGGKGTITVSARHAEHLPRSQGGDFVAISVADDGPGIPPHARELVFDPLFTTKPAGTGLGLAIVQTIVARHGGTIAFETEIGEGTTFTVVLASR
jgi:PAS domain S-box-containing protein